MERGQEQAREIIIDGCSIFVENVPQLDRSYEQLNSPRGALEWSTKKLKEAMRPAVKLLESLQETAKDLHPDKMEASIQFGLALKGETPVLKIASMEGKAEIAVKFVWEKDD